MGTDNQVASRVFQLEARCLDDEFGSVIDQSVDGLSIPKLSEELKLLMKLFTSINHIKDDSTIGMKVYNMRYSDGVSNCNKTSAEHPRHYKLLLLTCSNLILPYLVRRSAKLNQILNVILSRHLNLKWLTIDNLAMAAKFLSVINFIEFLRDGRYLTIQERLFNLLPTINEQDYFRGISLNKVQMELLYRETVWKVIAGFLTTVIPLINLTRIKNNALRATGLMPQAKSTGLNLAEKIMAQSGSNKCGICKKQVYNPYIIGCRHLYCYYCISSSYLSDPTPGYVCLQCNYSTKDSSQVQRYRIHQLQE